MFSGASVSHSVHRGLPPPHLDTPRWTDTAPPSELTSNGGHCSGRYASYWNAFLFDSLFRNVSFFYLN